MTREYYGPKSEAECVINQILNLSATGREQDWEVELANPARIDEMLDVLESKQLDFESESALALLLISSMEEASEAGMLDDMQIRRASQFFLNSSDIQERMCFYWLELGRSSDTDLVKRVLTC